MIDAKTQGRPSKTSATMQDVALTAGVSLATVSRVFNNEYKVRAKTRAKVLAAAEKLNYTPNSLARSLANSRSYAIGLLHDYPGSHYFNEILVGALNQCHQAGYNLVLNYCGSDFNNIEYSAIERLKSSNLQGVVILERVVNFSPIFRAVQKMNLAHVCLSSKPEAADSPYVSIDNYAAAFEMTAYLISLGHRKIGFIEGHPAENVSRLRRNGFLDALGKYGIEYNKKYLRQGDYSYQSGESAALPLLKLRDRPTAIFAANDYMATGVLAAAYRLNIRVPDQLSVAGFDDLPIASIAWPKLTTVRQHLHRHGEMAVKLLIDIINENNPGGAGITHTVDYELVARNSTARAPGASAAIDDTP